MIGEKVDPRAQQEMLVASFLESRQVLEKNIELWRGRAEEQRKVTEAVSRELTHAHLTITSMKGQIELLARLANQKRNGKGGRK